jgi:histidine triad (HIT) family protein
MLSVAKNLKIIELLTQVSQILSDVQHDNTIFGNPIRSNYNSFTIHSLSLPAYSTQIMATIFTKIIKGEIPSHKIAETEHYFAFLDIFPQTEGHTLVIPKIEIDYIYDLPPELLSGLVLFSQQIAHSIQKAIPCLRVGVAVVGLEVPHAHLHLIPIHSMDDINLSRKKLKPSPAELAATAEKIRQYC